jgi:hypothetical protein
MEFITGNNFKKYCTHTLDEHGFKEQKQHNTEDMSMFFVKTDYLDTFFCSSLLSEKKFILLTHNSDYNINSNHINYVEHPFLEKWYAQNVNFEHQKLIPIPIGIANSEWSHGDISVLESVMRSNFEKKQLMYANFNISTNYKQRSYCLKFIPNKYIENNVPFRTYLEHTAQSYFSICPLGNGIDSHRIWESLYLKTVPIAENTYNISYLKRKHNLPILLIDNWSDISNLDLNNNTYKNLMHNFNPDKLLTKKFLIQ